MPQPDTSSPATHPVRPLPRPEQVANPLAQKQQEQAQQQRQK